MIRKLRSGIGFVTSRRRWMVAVVLTALAAGCARDAAGPGAGAFPVAIAAQVGAGGPGVARAFDAADAAAVRVTVGGTVVLEETVSFGGGGEVAVSVALDRGLVGSVVSVEVTLLGGGAALFRGTGQTTLEESGTTVELDLEPVVARIDVADPVRVFTAIGESARLTGAAVFATGDTVPDVPLTWQALDPGIVAVESDGDATALDAGEARVEVAGAGMTTVTRARVDPQVERVDVTPATVDIAIGESVAFDAQPRDRNDNPLSVPVTWASSNTEVATIGPDGVAMALAAGRATIRASAGGVTGEAELVVRSVPRAPAGLEAGISGATGGDFELTWQDRSDDETYFDIERSVNDGPWERIGSAEGNATRFVGRGVPGSNALRVRACNANGCSTPSNEAILVFASGPPSVETLPSQGVGVMRGRVDTQGTYRVRFLYGEGCLCVTSPWVTRTAAGEHELVVPEAAPGAVFDYRIEAENGFGAAAGETLTLAVPYVDLAAPSYYEEFGIDLPITLSIVMPQGTQQSPIVNVDWSAENGGSFGPTSMHVEDGVTQVRFVYTTIFQPSDWEGHWIHAVAEFDSGLRVSADAACIAGPEGQSYFCFQGGFQRATAVGGRLPGAAPERVPGRQP